MSNREIELSDQRDSLLGESPGAERLNMLTGLVRRARIGWKLLLDGEVPWYNKLIPIATVAYIFSPLDLLPELVLGPFGVIDDVALLALALDLFIRVAPMERVLAHARELGIMVNDPRGQGEQAALPPGEEA